MKAKILFLCFTVSLSTFLMGFLLATFIEPLKILNNNGDNLPTSDELLCDTDKTEVKISCSDIAENDKNLLFKKLYYHRIILLGKDTNGRTFSNTFYFIRKQETSTKYSHAYTLLHTHGAIKKTLWTSVNKENEVIATDYYLPEFKEEKAKDLSTRESYSFKTKIDDLTYDINIHGIEGDFLVKNSPDYMRYVSSGRADVITSTGDKFTVNAMVDQFISYDYTVSIFFPRREELKSKTHSLTLWDEENNFYHLDITDVENTDLPYKTHRWVVYKDYKTGSKLKAFDAEVEFEIINKVPTKWKITIPDLDNTIIEINAVDYVNYKKLDGVAEGKVYNSISEKNISGQFFYDFKE